MTESASGELSSSRRIARNAFFRSAGEVVAKLGSVAFFIAMARKLGSTAFGEFSFALALSTVLLFASGFGMEDLIVREVARDRSRVHFYLSNVMAIKIGTSVLLLALAIGIAAISGHGGEVVLTVLIVGTGVAIENFGRTLHSVFQAFERMGFISIALIVQRIATAAVGIAVLASGGGLIAASLVFAGGSVLGALTGIWALRRFVVVPHWSVDTSRWMSLAKIAAPIGVATLFFAALLRLDVTLLGLLREESEVGIYSAAFRLIEATMFLSWAFAGAMMPWISRQRDGSERLNEGYELGLKGLTALLLPVSLLFVLLAEPIIHLLYGSAYDGSVFPLRMLGIMTLLYGINCLDATVLIARNRPVEFTRLVGIVAAVNVALNLLLIPRYGADGAAVSAPISALILAGLGLWRSRTVTGSLHPLRTFGGPIAAGGAMAAAVLLASVPLVPAALLGVAVYLLALAAFERAAFAEDFRMATDVIRQRRPSQQIVVPSEL